MHIHKSGSTPILTYFLSLSLSLSPSLHAEETGRDFTSVVSSLFQLMVDPHCRSISGFEALIQKEWVAMGHPFAARHALVLDPHKFGSEGELTEVHVCVCSITIHTYLHVHVGEATKGQWSAAPLLYKIPFYIRSVWFSKPRRALYMTLYV